MLTVIRHVGTRSSLHHVESQYLRSARSRRLDGTTDVLRIQSWLGLPDLDHIGNIFGRVLPGWLLSVRGGGPQGTYLAGCVEHDFAYDNLA